MYDLPDAPWIRDAEMNGMPSDETPVCPVCGAETDTYYLDEYGDVIGCDCCIRAVDAWDHQK